MTYHRSVDTTGWRRSGYPLLLYERDLPRAGRFAWRLLESLGVMGLCILPVISPRVGGGSPSHDPVFIGVRGPAPAETSRDPPLPATVL
ncbi:unnamed protein product [Camellia sinensis]